MDTEWGRAADLLDDANGGRSVAPPAILQLAVHRHSGTACKPQLELESAGNMPHDLVAEDEDGGEQRLSAWVIDCAGQQPSEELRSLVRWLLGIDSALLATTSVPSPPPPPLLVGFAFGHDIPRLMALSSSSLDNSNDDDIARSKPPDILDLQKAAMRHEHGVALTRRGGRHLHVNTPGLRLVTATWLGKRLDKDQQCSDWDARPLSAAQVQYAAADAAVLVAIAGKMGLYDAI